MTRCNTCSAPLSANTNLCHYCATRNDVDLRDKHDFSVHQQQSERICPHCEKSLQTVMLDKRGKFYIERCTDCFGIFFDINELEALLDNSVAPVYRINYEQLENINKERFSHNRSIKYITCPVCRNWMKRSNFAHRSGVIVDTCRAHGIWLDSGEISHLLEWKKAGGQLLQEKFSHRNKGSVKQTSNPAKRTEFSSHHASHRNNINAAKDKDISATLSSLLDNFFS